MNRLLAFFKLIRWPNLMMLAMVQAIVYFKFMDSSLLPTFHFALLNFTTLFIAAGGYLINDYYDYHIDSINNRIQFFTKNSIKKLAIVYFVIGLGIGFYLSFKSSLVLIFLFLLAMGILWFYATYFSRLKPIGNLLISLLILEAIYIIPLYSVVYNKTIFLFDFSLFYYAAFAFLFNYIREIVKDIEDMEGDKAYGRTTIPLLFGQAKSKIYLMILFKVALLFVYLSPFYERAPNLKFSFIIFTSIALFLCFRASEKKDFKLLSLMIKLLMFFGLISPLLF